MHQKKNINISFPVIPLRDTILFPNLVTPLLVGRDSSKESVRKATREDSPIVLVAQRKANQEDPTGRDLYRVGVLARILQTVSLPDGSVKILVEAFNRVRVTRFKRQGSWRSASIVDLPDLPSEETPSLKSEAIARIVIERFESYSLLNPIVPEGVSTALAELTNSGRIADTVAAHLMIRLSQKQKLLEILDPEKRLLSLADILLHEIEILEFQKSVDGKVRDRVQKAQKEYFLREQLKVIREELDGETDRSLAALEERIKASDMPEYARKAALRELDRLSSAQLHSPQASVSVDYIETLLALPWSKKTEESIELPAASKILDRDHYGLEDVKERVLEYLAVRKQAPGQRGQILCFIGPPGVGKTSIAHSIAEALNRKFVKQSLGGVRDEAEIRGHRRTYVAAMPGGIIKSITKAGSKNPLFLLDEIDKLNRDFHGDPGAALLEVLDPVERKTFVDHYVEVEFDLSDVFFVATANWEENIPPVLRDRMEIIRFSGYTPNEKNRIAKKHLIPQLLKEHGLTPRRLRVGTGTISAVIEGYTREAGVRELRRKLAALCRKAVRKLSENSNVKSIGIKPAGLEEYLGPPPFFNEVLEDCGPGTATGLAWTEAGGTIMQVEVSLVPGRSRIILTGSLGSVMQESARAALTYVRSNAETLGVTCERTTDLHVHVPEGATPKDGPSAGIAILAALVSAYRKQPIDPKIALTGEITLRGRVLPVGGIREKLLAAQREGVRKVIMPERNRADLRKVPKEVLDKLDICFVSRANQACRQCGLG